MKILVTGANGLLGNAVCKILKEQSIEFVKLTRQILDLSDYNKSLKYFSENVYTHIINAAAMTNVDLCETEKEKCYNDNVKTVKNILSCSHARLIHVSTDFVFDGTIGNLKEDAEVKPINYYGKCKLEAEQIVAQYPNTIILRTQLVHGPAKKNIISWVKESLEQKKEISLLIDQLRCPTYVDDLAIACVNAAKLNASGLYHVAGKDTISPYLLAVEVAKYFKLDKKYLKKIDSETLNQTAKRPLKTTFNIEKAILELNYNPRSIKDSFKEY